MKQHEPRISKNYQKIIETMNTEVLAAATTITRNLEQYTCQKYSRQNKD
jgi:hypothetical protein